MNSTQAIYEGIKESGIDFIVSLPCANLKTLLELVEDDPEIRHIPVPREEEGFAIAAGAYMAGRKTAILMQNSGLGNSINVLTSLLKLYNIPILMIISHRGTYGEPICGQVPMGKATTKILDSIDLTYKKIDSPETARKIIPQATKLAQISQEATALLFDINYWTEGE